ncbi:anti-repressor SinI family protein [Virgibacillus halophilus]|uniref:Anti-repressor SinI family protein n=1 Tax=Tigheibacillus halophilus TaxID=361280 RepID=A0ABU5C901_9BACI|nr:anti-repressor SinI family protein [Virgibacillus halophilus]
MMAGLQTGVIMQGLDEEWVMLILAAKELGLTKGNVRDFLNEEL